MEEKEKSIFIVSGPLVLPGSSIAVFSQEKDALETCQIHDLPTEIAPLDEYCRFYDGECTRAQIRIEAKSVYILLVMIDGGGECYGREAYQSVHEFKRDILSAAVEWYDGEHNRDDECKRCAIDEKACKKRFICRLRKVGYFNISDCCSVTMDKVDIIV